MKDQYFIRRRFMKIPRGIIPAMLSVFDNKGEVNIAGQKNFTEWLIKKGVHGLAPCGSTGEGAALSDDERVKVVKAVVEQSNSRVPVFAVIIHYFSF
jgi:4-hydroxy-tetrahydrodipicolinate synthase